MKFVWMKYKYRDRVSEKNERTRGKKRVRKSGKKAE